MAAWEGGPLGSGVPRNAFAMRPDALRGGSSRLDPMIVPNVVLAGVRKCGTTSVYDWLSVHPSVATSPAKGTEFLMDRDSPYFNPESNYHHHGLGGYSRYFRAHPDKQVRLDATTRYFDQETARRVLASLDPQPHVVFVLREPADRLFSLFRYEKNNRRRIAPQARFSDFVHDLFENRADALLAGGRRRELEREQHREWSELVGEFAHSRYVEYLLRWKALFRPERLHVYLFENLQHDAPGFMEALARDIGIDPAFYCERQLVGRNPSVDVRSPAIHRVVRGLAPVVPRNRMTRALYGHYLRLQDSGPVRHTAEERDALTELRRHYRPYNGRLAHAFGLDLTPWHHATGARGDPPISR